MCVCVCVRACVRACVHACVRACESCDCLVMAGAVLLQRSCESCDCHVMVLCDYYCVSVAITCGRWLVLVAEDCCVK